jgi:hypothetical protein
MMSASILNFETNDALGSVLAVDTATVNVRVDDIQRLRQMQVNRLVALRSSRAGQHLIGIVQKITRSAGANDAGGEDGAPLIEINQVKVTLIGTLVDREGQRRNVFKRTLESVPEIDAECFAIEGQRLTDFMRVISAVSGEGQKLAIGQYTLDDRAEAYLNGNKFFQRHAMIVGSTGSGKSWTTARVLEQLAALPQANAIVCDVHGEYGTLVGDGFRHFRVAGPADLDAGRSLDDGVLHIPYWLLGYESLVSMLVDGSDQNAPNQAMVMSRSIIAEKRRTLETGGHDDVLRNFTIDSPVPFCLDSVVAELARLNEEMVSGARAGTEKQGEFHGKLSRLLARVEAKRSDRRLGFLFNPPTAVHSYEWLPALVAALVAGSADQPDAKGGVKVIDFSEVPSDVLPLMVSLIARIIFSVQQWTALGERHPIALICDEAHLYIPERSLAGSAGAASLAVFERIAKEGRKYGVGLVVVTQRPSEVSRTVLSQCGNLLAMRLTNGDDQAVVRRLLPDSLGGFGDLLPILDTGEALVVGDASLLPTRIRVSEPTTRPNSGTVDFWDRWSLQEQFGDRSAAVQAWRRQTVA